MTAPSWLTEGAHPVRRAQIERDHARRERRTGGRSMPRESVADLHYQLGKLVEDRPGVLHLKDSPRWDTNERCLEIDPLPHVNTQAGERLQEIAADAREEMGEERWAELQREWDESND